MNYFVWSPSSSPFNSINLQARLMVKHIISNGFECRLISPESCSFLDLVKLLNSKNSLVIWHFGSFDLHLVLSYFFKNIIIVYHNITPWQFFIKTRPLVAVKSALGRLQLYLLRKDIRYVGVSEFNKVELDRIGKFNTYLHPCYVRTPKPHIFKKSRHPSVFFVGRVAENKGVGDLLKVIDLVSRRIGRRIILILKTDSDGRGVHHRNFVKNLENLAISGRVRIVWLDKDLEEEVLDKIYQFAWLYASASLHEGFGLPVVEAIRNGTPAIYKSCGGTESVLDGVGCVGLEDDNLADGIFDVLSNIQVRHSLLESQFKIVENKLRSQAGSARLEWLYYF